MSKKSLKRALKASHGHSKINLGTVMYEMLKLVTNDLTFQNVLSGAGLPRPLPQLFHGVMAWDLAGETG